MNKPDINKGKSTAKKFMGEFKTFAVKGNVMDLAIGVMIGGAFTAIVTSVVKDIAMPIIGMFTGGATVPEWSVKLPNIFNKTTEISLNIGNFINAVVSFLILAFVVFIFVKFINRLKKKEEKAPASPPITNEEKLLAEIRDLLKEQRNK